MYPLRLVSCKFIILAHKNIRWSAFLLISSLNSAHFDRWTISVGPVVPEIPPPPICQFLSGYAQRNSANPRKSLIHVKKVYFCVLKHWFWLLVCDIFTLTVVLGAQNAPLYCLSVHPRRPGTQLVWKYHKQVAKTLIMQCRRWWARTSV